MNAVLLSAARWLLKPSGRRFRAALREPEEAQRRVQERIWRDLRATEYGSRFSSFDAVPIATWADLAPWHERQRDSTERIILTETPSFYETTSGSAGPPKRIPITPTLRRLFTRMFAIWAHDILHHGPRLRTGKIYFANSPRIGATEGSMDDRDFLGGCLGTAASLFWLAPDRRSPYPDAATYWSTLSNYLLRQPRLEILSVWSPTFLTVLLDWMVEHRTELPRAQDIGRWDRIWPELKLISCWDSGSAAIPAQRLRQEFPAVLVQGKGLLATEGPVTVPWIGHGAVPLIDDVLIELLDGDRLLPLMEARPGSTYELVMSHAGGFVRYRLGDQVEIVGHMGKTPLLRFVGRTGGVDLVGEKLREPDVISAFEKAGLRGEYACLVAAGDHYRLILTRPEGADLRASAVDQALHALHHYRLARTLGQLKPVEPVYIPDAARRALEAGPTWGGTKPTVLRATAPEFEFGHAGR